MTTLAQRQTTPRSTWTMRRLLGQVSGTVFVTGLGMLVMVVFLMPLGYMLATAFKLDSQLSAQNAPLWPV